jgi:hypothetical protein
VLVAIVIALCSIAFGTALGLLPGSSPRAGGPFQTFALVTAVAVVLGQLLPDSLAAIGMPALLAFAVGFAIPRVAERVATAFRKPACTHDDAMCTDLGLELGYVALILHHIGDGVGIGLFTSSLHAGHEHYDVLIAFAGHTVPVAALLALAFKTHRGALSAIWRALGIGASVLIGVALANMLSHEHLVVWEPWLTALVGGLLLHIVAHGWPVELRPTRASRLVDFAAIAAGLALVSVGGHSHAPEHGGTAVRPAMAHALLELGLDTAPMLLIGLLAAAWLQTQGARIPAGWLASGGRFTQALRGALIGLPLPVSACGILPVVHGLRARGSAPAVVVAFLLAAPALGIDSFALSARFLGWPFALWRVLAVLAVAVAGALLIALLAKPPDAPNEGPAARPFADGVQRPFGSQLIASFDALLHHVGAWTLLGLIVAAYLQAALEPAALVAFSGTGLDILLVSLVALPSYVSASSAMPLAAVLLGKGMSPGAVLAGLLLGPAIHVATIAWLRKSYGSRAAYGAIAGVLITVWAFAFAVSWVLPAGTPLGAVTLAPHEHGAFSYAAALVLLGLVARAVWRDGLRSWLGSLGDALAVETGDGQGGPALQPHAHGHGHGHARHEAAAHSHSH